MRDQSPDNDTELIDLREFLGVLRRRKWTVILTTLLVTGAALTLVALRSPTYKSTARVEVNSPTIDSDPNADYYLQQGMDTEAARVTSASVANSAETKGAPEGSVRDIDTSVPSGTKYIDISCTQPTPDAAQECAAAYAHAYVEGRIKLAHDTYDAVARPLQDAIDLAETDTERETAQLQLLSLSQWNPQASNVASPAELPLEPANKDYITTGVLALIVGLALGIGLAFIRDRLDERIAGRHDMEKALGAPVLAVVPKVPGWRNHKDTKLVTLTAPTGAASEAYRTARTSLLYLAREGGLHAITVTGPGQGEGKTTTVINLAVALAQSGQRVIAVSCDLRRPRLHRFLGLSNEVGLTEVLQGQADVKNALLKTSVPGLIVIPSGHVPHNPAELLASPATDDLLAKLRSAADIVLLDTPPSLVGADALELAPKTDGVLVVADAGTTHRSSLQHLTSQIERVGGTVIGAILNNFDRSSAKYYEPYGKYYGGDGYQSQESDEPPELASANGNDSGPSSNGHVPADDTVKVPESAPAEDVAASVPDVPAPPVDDADKKRRFSRRSRSSAEAAAIESAPLTDPGAPPLPDGLSKWD